MKLLVVFLCTPAKPSKAKKIKQAKGDLSI